MKRSSAGAAALAASAPSAGPLKRDGYVRILRGTCGPRSRGWIVYFGRGDRADWNDADHEWALVQIDGGAGFCAPFRTVDLETAE